jgi:protein-L-isoaspartate O-methyltransferase
MHLDKFKLYDIAEQYMELINPFSSEKIITIGKFLNLKKDDRIIEFGSGFAEILVLWAESFGTKGIGIDIREHACERAQKKITERNLNDRIRIECIDGSKFKYEKGSFDVAACIGASFIWGGFRETILGMKDAIHPKGKLVIGEPYWITEPVPEEYLNKNEGIYTEIELLKIAREEGFDIEYMVRANNDDWDRYEASNWYSLSRWIEENQDHPDLQQVIDWYHEIQDDYLKYGREYCGWAVYILNPIKY